VSTAELVIKAQRVLTGTTFSPATVVVSDGRISAIESFEAAHPVPGVVELAGDEVLIPGLVDTHVHINEPGRTEWEGFATATRAAAAGGITTIVDMPLNSIPPTIDPAALDGKRRAAGGQAHVDLGFWGGAVPASLGGLRALHDAGVCGFKCFLLDSGVAEFPPLDADQLVAAMREIAAFDGLLIVHAEDGPTISAAAGGPSARQSRKYHDFLRSRPPESEDIAIGHVVDAARRTGARAHIVHLSSAGAVDRLVRARDDGVRVSVETCPHYLTLTAEEVPDGDTRFKCCPPIRGLHNQDLLWQALADGVVDIIVSDHSPSPPALKRLDTGDFFAAWGGVSSLQLSLPAVWTQARQRGHDLARVVGWMSTGPAELAGLATKGRIQAGHDADLVVFAPDGDFVVDPATLQHRHPLTPYAGKALTGVVRRTYLRGEPVTGSAPHGRLIEPQGTRDD
jgi:allantoinase